MNGLNNLTNLSKGDASHGPRQRMPDRLQTRHRSLEDLTLDDDIVLDRTETDRQVRALTAAAWFELGPADVSGAVLRRHRPDMCWAAIPPNTNDPQLARCIYRTVVRHAGAICRANQHANLTVKSLVV
jgi:hypothetical protein